MDEAGRDKLWKNYISTRSAEYRDELIVEYAQLVKLVAGRLNMYLGYNVEYDDLVGYGIFGLIDAIDKFDYGKNVKFETYASLRIRGAILDQIRKMDWIPRSLRQKQKRIEAAMAKIESETGHIASDEELAAELEITIDELADWQGKMKASNLISLDEYTEAGSEVKMESAGNSHFDQPEEAIEKEELKKMIKTGETISVEAILLEEKHLQDIRNLPHVFDVHYENQILTLRCTGAQHNLIRLLNYLQSQDITFGRVFSELPTLNDVFLEITGKQLRD